MAVYRHSSHGTWTSVVVGSGLHCSKACGTLVPPRGIEFRSPALQDRFITTGPPGKSLIVFFLRLFLD